jgi:integrase
MASLRRKATSRFFWACYTDLDGKQCQVSTKETSRAKALKIAEQYEATYRMKLTEVQARKVISDIYQIVRGDVLYQATTRAFLTGWLTTKNVEIAPGSRKRYQNAVDKLLVFLGDRADRDIAYVDRKDLLALRDKTATELCPSTANTDLKILRVAFGRAVSDGLRLDNPAKAVSALKIRTEPGAPERRSFTEEEIKKLLAVVTGEWRGIILAGLYTGQRLGDIASLTWQRVDLENECITVRTLKTGRTVIVPIHRSLLTYLRDAWAHRDAAVPAIFPIASKSRVDSDGESRQLSAKFHGWLEKAGLAQKRPKKNTGRGHSVRRTVSELSFHSLRHTATTWLKNAGVPESVVRDIIGHESELVSRGYTHVDEETKRKAIRNLPTFT